MPSQANGGFKRLFGRSLFVAATAWLARAASVGCGLVTMPLIISRFGDDGYGVFVVVLSLFSWFSLLDLGLANALVNPIAERRARGEAIDGYLVAAGLATLALSAFWWVVLFLCSGSLSAVLLGKISVLSASQAKSLFLTAGSLMLLAGFGNIGLKRPTHASTDGFRTPPSLSPMHWLLSASPTSVTEPRAGACSR